MEKLRLKFVWGGASRIKGEWHLGLWGWYDRLPGFRHSGLAISVRGLLAWLAGGLVAVWFAAATALYFHFRQDPFNQVTFADTVLLPARWGHVKEVRGRMMIEEGLVDLKQRRWAEGVMKLRAGLTRAPHDTRARLALGQFYAMANQRANAVKVLTEDLGHGYPGRKYLEALFGLATDAEDYEVIVATCDRFAAEPADRSWRELQRNIALLRAQRGEEVLQALKAKTGSPTESDRETKVTALIELGRAPEALVELDKWERLERPDRALVLKLKIRVLRETGRRDELETAAQQYRALAPSDPRVLAYVIAQHWLAGQTAAAQEELGEYFRRFSAREDNLIVITKAAGDAKATVLVAQCAGEAAAHGFGGKNFRMTLAQAQLACGEWAAAAKTVEQMKATNLHPEPGEAFVQDWMARLLAVASAPDVAPLAGLLEMLQQRPVSMRVYRQSADVLVRARRFTAVRELCELGERVYPGNQTLAEFRREAAEALKPPPVPVVATVAARPVAAAKAEKEFFLQLELAEKEQRWADAAQAIREARTNKPRWMEGLETDVLEAQLRVAARQDDALELIAAARLLLDGSAMRAERVLTLACEWAAAGDRVNAGRLLQEVLRRNPGYPPALRLKAEWNPPPVANKAAAGPPTTAPVKTPSAGAAGDAAGLRRPAE